MDSVLASKSSLGMLGFPPQLPKSSVALAEVLAMLFLNQFDEVLHNSQIKILTSKMNVAISGKNLKTTVIDCQDTGIKCPTT